MQILKKIILASSNIVALAAVACVFQAHSETTCSLVSDALRAAAEIRGLNLQSKVSCVIQDKDEVKRFILNSVEEQLTPEQIESDSLMYKAFGLIPEDWDYKSQLVELYLSQIGGYYDPKLKRYAMASWLPDFLQTSIAVHELTHALQDQHYNLQDFNNPENFTTDQQLARAALIEGDATAVMIDHPRRMLQQPPLSELQDVENLVLQQTLSLALSPNIRNAPEAISYTIMFPYASGLRFAHALLKKGGYGTIDRAYKRPPRSTEEILHTEKFFREEPDFHPISDEEVLKSAKLSSLKVLSSDTWGEFMLSMLLTKGNSKQKAAEAAGGWAGDRVLIAQDRETKHIILLTHLDSHNDQLKFFEAAKAYRDSIQAKRTSGKFSVPTISKTDNQGILIRVTYQPHL